MCPYPTIANPKTTTGSSYGGDVPNKIQRLLNDYDIADVDVTEKPKINTDFRFRSQRLQLIAGTSDYVIKHKTVNLLGDASVLYPDNLSTTVDNEIAFVELIQEFKNKVVSTEFNSIVGIRNSNIATDAAIAKSKLAALGIVDADVTGPITTAKLTDGATFLKNTTDNALGTHYYSMTKMTAPGNPATNTFNLYVDTADNKFKKKNSAGTVVDLELTGATNLDGLSDATIASPLNDQVIAYETASSQWKNKTLTTERVGTGTATGGSTNYQITHNLGSLPYNCIVLCSSHNNIYIYSVTSTVISVTFAVAPTGTVTFHWRVVA